MQTFKILKGMAKVDAGKFFAPHQSTHTTKGHDMRVAKKHYRLDSRKFFYSQRSVESFNACPPSAIKSNTILSFKKAISENTTPGDWASAGSNAPCPLNCGENPQFR
jgi:hypothetical protein